MHGRATQRVGCERRCSEMQCRNGMCARVWCVCGVVQNEATKHPATNRDAVQCEAAEGEIDGGWKRRDEMIEWRDG